MKPAFFFRGEPEFEPIDAPQWGELLDEIRQREREMILRAFGVAPSVIHQTVDRT